MSPPAVLHDFVATGRLLEILHIHAVDDRIVRGDGCHAKAQKPADAEGYGKQCHHPQGLPGWKVGEEEITNYKHKSEGVGAAMVAFFSGRLVAGSHLPGHFDCTV